MEPRRSDTPESLSGSPPDLERLLEEKARLEEMIRSRFTRVITVMFTDFKGSTSLAECEGDVATRMLIKKHHDILIPLLREGGGTLVKTMGDGTLSWFEEASAGVRTAVRFQRELASFNRERPFETPIVVRIGLNTGSGIVESNDVFGDVVNVASRFESIAAPKEILVSEPTFEALEPKGEFPCRLVRTTELKGKAGLHKVFKVYWDPAELARDEAAHREAMTPRPASPGAPSPPPSAFPAGLGRRLVPPGAGGRVSPDPRRPLEAKALSREKEEVTAATDIEGFTVRAGDVRKLAGDRLRVRGEIVVEEGGVLVVEGSQLFFEKGRGISCAGALRAKGSLFSALDPGEGWGNVAVALGGDRVSFVEQCTFRLGRGRPVGPRLAARETAGVHLSDSLPYGGGLLVAGGKDRPFTVSGCTFHRCGAYGGGGVALLGGSTTVSGTTFERCSATNVGGGILAYGAAAAMRGCRFQGCSSQGGGGGVACVAADPLSIEDSSFDGCATDHHHGGGLLSIISAPRIAATTFVRCQARRSGGALFCDEGSRPSLQRSVTYTDCTPSAT